MRRLTVLAIPSALLALFITSPLSGQGRADFGPQPFNLQRAVSEWQYPASRVQTSSGGGGSNPSGWVKKYQAIMITPDPIEKVVKFYEAKVGETAPDGGQIAKASARDAETSAVSTQDDSQGRPVSLRVIVAHRANETTTLVISRAEGEKETHIAWSHVSSSGARQ